MYVILVNNDNTMSAPKKQRIMQRTKLVDDLIFLVHPQYNDTMMQDCTVMLEYLLPVSKRYKTEILSLCSDRYEEYLKYKLPIDTELTAEAGKIELQLTFAKADLSPECNGIQKVRKVTDFYIEVLSISKWSDIIPDDALSSIDQRLIKVDAQMKAMNDMNTMMYMTKADNISYDGNKLQLTANGEKIGNAIDITSCENDIEDGVPVVDFSNSTDFVTPDDTAPEDKEHDNVVEFDPLSGRNVNNVVEF